MDSSFKKIEKQLINDPFNHELRLDYARILQNDAVWEESLHQYELLIKQQFISAEIYTGAAFCLYHLTRKKEAVNKYAGAKKYDDFIPVPELEELMRETRAAVPVLEVISGQAGKADVLQLYTKDDDKICFKDIAGMDYLKKILRMQIIEPFLRPGIFARFKKKAGGGILLYGPPGCGKTMIAKAVSAECNAYYISVGISDVLNMWVGESERNLAAIFEKARAHKPSLLFFDELDALAYSRSKSDSHHGRTVVNEFLAQMDGINSDNDQVLILSASNMPWDIDPAMKRPGRFSRQIFIPPPDTMAREEMLRLKLEEVPADIDGIIDLAKESALMDILESGEERNLKQEDLFQAVNKYHPSTIEWLKTACNLARYAGANDSYRDVEKYLKKKKLL